MADVPASMLLVHGAGSGPWIFDSWLDTFPGVHVGAVDLHDGLDVARASMHDYAARVAEAAGEMPRPVAVCGWSMGGLAAMMAADAIRPHSLVLLEPSPPGELQGFHPGAPPASGTFDPEAEYGPFPAGTRARPESARARAERKCGISVPALACPTLVVYGDEFAEARGAEIARFYGTAERYFPGLDHWGLILDPRVRRAVAEFAGVAFRRGGIAS